MSTDEIETRQSEDCPGGDGTHSSEWYEFEPCKWCGAKAREEDLAKYDRDYR